MTGPLDLAPFFRDASFCLSLRMGLYFRFDGSIRSQGFSADFGLVVLGLLEI